MAEKQTYGVLDNVVLAYAKVAETSKKYQSEDLEYSVDCIVEKAVAKAWNKQFPKQKAKELDAEDFTKKFKMEPPFSGDEVFIIKMKKAATKGDTVYDEKYRPKVLLDMKNGERVDITTSRLISNGSKARVSYRITENSFGIFGQLNNILMDEDGFVEYVSQGAGNGSEFGDSKPVTVEPSRKEVTQARADKPVKATKPPIDDSSDDSSSPF